MFTFSALASTEPAKDSMIPDRVATVRLCDRLAHMNRFSASKLTIAAAILTCALASEVAASDLRCPQDISVEQHGTTPAPEWEVSYNGFKNELASITIYEGPPEEGASLVYDDQKTVNNTIVESWKLSGSKRGYWLKCGYSNTSAEISRKLPSEVNQCVVVLEQNVSFADGRRPIRSAVCSVGR